MSIKNTLKYLLISWILVGAVVAPTFATQSKSSLTQKLKQTNNKRYYFQQKKRQADLKLKTEKNKLSNNQQKLEKAQVELKNTTERYNSLVSNLSSMEHQLNTAIYEFRSIDAQMKSRIRQVYKHQRSGMFELILSATDVNSINRHSCISFCTSACGMAPCQTTFLSMPKPAASFL